MTLDEAIKRYRDKEAEYKELASIHKEYEEFEMLREDNCQLVKWLTELKEAKGIIRVCNRVLGFLLECEIKNTSTRQEVETLLKGITEYMSGGSENG